MLDSVISNPPPIVQHFSEASEHLWRDLTWISCPSVWLFQSLNSSSIRSDSSWGQKHLKCGVKLRAVDCVDQNKNECKIENIDFSFSAMFSCSLTQSWASGFTCRICYHFCLIRPSTTFTPRLLFPSKPDTSWQNGSRAIDGTRRT